MPAIAARSICDGALSIIGVSAAEQPVSAHMAMQALETLNTMLDAWSLERLLTWTRPRYVLPLVTDKGTYTWGLVAGETTPADIPHTAPVRLEIALMNIGGTPAQEWAIHLLTQEEWETQVWFKDLPSAYVEAVYLEDTHPYSILHAYPVPMLPYCLILLPWQAHSPYESYDAVLDWPKGYREAFEWNLAPRLAVRYGMPVSPDIRQMAEESKRALYVPNTEIGSLRLDPRRPVGVSRLGYNPAFLRGD